MRYFYGFSHTYGSTACDDEGNDIGRVYRFATQEKRDAWVAAGNAYDGPDYREALPANHPEVRRAIWIEDAPTGQ